MVVAVVPGADNVLDEMRARGRRERLGFSRGDEGQARAWGGVSRGESGVLWGEAAGVRRESRDVAPGAREVRSWVTRGPCCFFFF